MSGIITTYCWYYHTVYHTYAVSLFNRVFNFNLKGVAGTYNTIWQKSTRWKYFKFVYQFNTKNSPIFNFFGLMSTGFVWFQCYCVLLSFITTHNLYLKLILNTNKATRPHSKPKLLMLDTMYSLKH